MEGRKRLYHWLKKNVEKENFGLKWIDREKELFRIPWIHKHNKSWNKRSCQVFKEWAKVTNRYRDGDPEDWPGWKTRLRTALTKLPYFEEVHDLHRLENTDFPYKVYRFVPKDKSKDVSDYASSTGGSPGCFQPVEFSQSSSQRVDISPSSSQQNALSPSNSQFTDFSPSNSQFTDFSPSNSQFTNFSPSNSQGLEISSSPSQHAALENVSSASPAYYFDALSPNFKPEDINNSIFHLDRQELTPVPVSQHNQPSNWNILPTCQISNEETDVQRQSCRAAGGRLPSDLVNVNLMESRLPSSEMELYKREPKKHMAEFKIYYLNEEVCKGNIFDAGLHCYFGPIFDISSHFYEKMFGPKELEKFEFPDVNTMSKSMNSEQQHCLEDILLKLDRGFLLQFDEHGSMYARRLCRTRIFANNLMLGETSICLDRKRQEYTKLFDMEKFRADVTSYSPVTNMTFAQDYKRSDSTRKILMRMELVHLEAQHLQEKLVPPSSKPSLQFSDCNSGDLLLHQIASLSLAQES